MTYFIDLLASIGFCVIVYGVWLVHQPSAFIVGGIFCLVLSVFLSLPLKRAKPK